MYKRVSVFAPAISWRLNNYFGLNLTKGRKEKISHTEKCAEKKEKNLGDEDSQDCHQFSWISCSLLKKS